MSRILITGGTGTFGRAFIRHLLVTLYQSSRKYGGYPYDSVVSYSRDEQKIAQLGNEFGHHAPFKAFMGDVRDPVRLGQAFRGVDVVVHAAALKRIDVGAYSPSELIRTNINGTENVINAAIQNGVKRVVVISSDKAVQPTNLYGATKHCAETYAVQANSYGYPSGTMITAVRYGNITGSRGSVIGIWRDQIKHGLPISITDAAMTRFMMTIEQAVKLVMFAIEHTQGGEIFVPILPRAFVKDIATAVMPRSDWPIEWIGLRPGGEKLAESLLSEEEPTRTRLTFPRGHLAIAPSHHEWVRKNFPWQGTTETLDAHTRYRSDESSVCDNGLMTVDSIREMIASTETLL